MFKIARERWKVFNQILADSTAWFFSLVFYYTVMIPFGIGMRLLGDPLAMKTAPHWRDREPVLSSLEEARRQG